MFRRSLYIIIMLISLCLFGCTPKLENQIADYLSAETQIAEAANYNIRFHLPRDWYEEPIKTWDLHYTNDYSWFNAYTYKCIDLAKDETPMDKFENHNNYLVGIRDNFEEVIDGDVELLNNEFVTSKLFSGEKDGVKNWYYCALVDFGENKDFAWVLFTGIPSYMQTNFEMYNDILNSAKIID